MNRISRLWLTTRTGKMELSYPLGIRPLPHKETLSSFGVLSHIIINPLLTKLVRSRWLDIDLVLFSECFWTSTSSRSINTQKKNLANIQPSWPRARSITRIACSLRTVRELSVDWPWRGITLVGPQEKEPNTSSLLCMFEAYNFPNVKKKDETVLRDLASLQSSLFRFLSGKRE